jgi:pilus assembly protein CpaE
VVLDLPRSMMVQHPHLLADVQAVVVVTELTLAATRDAIRILSWLKTNAPSARVIVVANRVLAGQSEVSHKDFEASIERKIDIVVPHDSKLAIQAAKLGKPLAEIAKSLRRPCSMSPTWAPKANRPANRCSTRSAVSSR